MKYNKIMAFFAISLSSGIILRIMQVFFTIDSHGFTFEYYKNTDLIITSIVLISVIASAFMSSFVYIKPQKPPEMNPFLSVMSEALGLFTLWDMAGIVRTAIIPVWQFLLIKILALVVGIFWILYGLHSVIKIKIPNFMFIIPVFYWLIRLIYVFTSVYALSITSSHILLLLAYCSVLIFMLQMAKLINGLDTEYNFKKVLISGICAVSFCSCYSIPYLLQILLRITASSIESAMSTLLIFVAGIFIFSFILTFFGKRNTETNHSDIVKK